MSQASRAAAVPLFAQDEIDRQLPTSNQIFLDHVGHFVGSAEAASRALARAGFTPTPPSIQLNPDPSGGTSPTGTGNVTAMFERGYVEVLFKTADTALGREFDTALAHYPGIHLAAFAVADAQSAHERLAADGFRVRPLAKMQRPVETEAGDNVAAFTIARVEPGVMPEGRIQMLTHHTEVAVWRPRWLSHPNSASGLIDVVIAVADVAEAAARFARFTRRTALPWSGGAMLQLDRGRVVLITKSALGELTPDLAIPALPFMAGDAVGVRSLAAAQAALTSGQIEWRAFSQGVIARFPAALGGGVWFFVEKASALPWRR